MDPIALKTLLVELFAAIQLVSAYSQPPTLPEVHAVAAEVMQQKICGRPCPVKAFYHPEWGVYLDRDMDVFGDAFERSILLHELVHHLQRTSGKFHSVPGDCFRRNAEEREAYEIQNRYLSRQGVSKRALAVGRTQMCRDSTDR
jgi:hypothetical protein